MRRADANREEKRSKVVDGAEEKECIFIQRHKNKGKEIKNKVQKWKRVGDNRREQKRKGVTKVKKARERLKKIKQNKIIQDKLG